MKRWTAVLLALLMLLQMAGPFSAFAADPTMTVTVYDDEGGIIFQGSYTGDRFGTDELETYFPGLTAEQKEAIGKSTNIKVESSLEEGQKGPAVAALDNAEGQGVNLEIQTDTAGVTAMEQAQVTVVGDTAAGVVADDRSSVTVDGSVSGQDSAIHASEDAEVTVKGDVGTEGVAKSAVITVGAPVVTIEGSVNAGDALGIFASDFYEDPGTGNEVYVDNQSQITVTGDVTSDGSAVITLNHAEVEIGGNVTATHGYGIDASTSHVEGEITGNDSTITVQGSVSGFSGGVLAQDHAHVEVGGDVSGGHITTDGEAVGYGIETFGQAEVAVDGSVSGQDSAIKAWDETRVTVGGDVTTEGDTFATVVTVGSSEVTIEGSVLADDAGGIYTQDFGYDSEEHVDNGSRITVTGDVRTGGDAVATLNHATVEIGGDVSSSSGDGIYASQAHTDGPETGNESTVIVGGNVSGYQDGVLATDQAHVEVGGNVSGGHIGSDGDPEGTGITAYGQAEVSVQGNVTSESTGIRANGSSEISVGGNVESRATAVIVQGSAAVTVGGNVSSEEGIGIYTDVEDESGNLVENHASVTVDGNVTTSGMWDAVWTASQAEVTVHGDVTAEGEGASAIAALSSGFETLDTGNQSTIVVDGNASAKEAPAILMMDDANITVQGDVTGGTQSAEEEEPAPDPSALTGQQKAFQEAKDKAYEDVETAERQDGAVEIYLDEDGSEGQLIVGGTVSTANGDAPIVINYTVKDEGSLTEMPDLPELKIYEIAPKDGEYFDVNVSLEKELNYSWTDGGGSTQTAQETTDERVQLSEEDHAKMVEAIAAAIQYIIKLDASLDNATVEMPGHYDEASGLFTAHENEAVSVTVRPDAGYDFDGNLYATGNYTLTQNEDGSWTLTVLRGGGVTLSAVITRRPVQTVKVDQSPSGLDHPAVGRIVRFGRYDFDGDGAAEELTWKILRVAGGYARLAMFTGIESIPADFDSAFSAHEKAQIREGSLMALDPGMARGIFGDGLTHPSMYVKLGALDLD